jgi:hypothetical protein
LYPQLYLLSARRSINPRRSADIDAAEVNIAHHDELIVGLALTATQSLIG